MVNDAGVGRSCCDTCTAAERGPISCRKCAIQQARNVLLQAIVDIGVHYMCVYTRLTGSIPLAEHAYTTGRLPQGVGGRENQARKLPGRL